ncbi:MAG: hypothetical protein AABW83_00080 [Nanoarchaeota archaeon]
MIINRIPINMSEIEKLIQGIEDSEKKEKADLYLKKFLKTSSKKAKEINDKIEALDSIKIKNEHIVKIIDLLPEDASDLIKIFNDVSLTEEEINKILEIVKD